MRITKINIKNFRLLKDVTVDLEEELSLILGKNNCGKTSLLLVMEKFLGNKGFSYDDFNADLKDELKRIISDDYMVQDGEIFPFLGISLKLFIEYDENDDLSNIGNKVIMDLDPDNKVVVLSFEYCLSKNQFIALKSDYQETNQKKAKDAFSFIKENHANYFQLAKKSIQYNPVSKEEDERIFTDLIKEKVQIDKIISFKWISANRNLSNKDTEKTLSSQSAKIYKKLEEKNGKPDIIAKFRDALSDTDKNLSTIYTEIFQEVIDDVKMFGGIKQNETAIKIISSLQHKDLLEENTTVVYCSESNGHELPENYNGLGYMNLISMIFEIKILLHEFGKEENETLSDINLLFIEEPEVHTHPQMQRIFIKNIKSLLQKGIEREDGQKRKLQTIISTHSSHIVSESDFEDIKYFKKENGGILSKNLKDLKNEYGEEITYYKFLKQYLTLHRSELFFADKAIFIEGDTERILLPAMMKKIDQTDEIREVAEKLNTSLPLHSQNISIIEVGAYSHIFENFMDFLGIKSLIITDIDSVKSVPRKNDRGEIQKNADGTDKMDEEKCLVSEGTKTSNSSLKYFFNDNDELSYFINLPLNDRILKKNSVSKKWERDPNGNLLCIYQTEEDGYHARSFEDAFLHINKEFMGDHTFDKQNEFIGDSKFPSLPQKMMKLFAKSEIDAYKLADGVNKKPSFAMEILLNSTSKEITIVTKTPIVKEFSNWNTPAYIEEGLQWLKRD